MESIRQLNRVLSEIKNQLKTIETSLQQPLRPGNDWLDHQDVCRRLRISKRTLDHYRETGLLPFSKLGGNFYYRRRDIDEYLEKHIVLRRNS